MPTDIFIVRITPSTGKKTGETFPWIKISRLERKRRTPKPKLKINESGYREVDIEHNLAVPKSKVRLKKVATQVGMAIFRKSKNSNNYTR
jgi:hypothetical protein